jgi:hypothetical protein
MYTFQGLTYFDKPSIDKILNYATNSVKGHTNIESLKNSIYFFLNLNSSTTNEYLLNITFKNKVMFNKYSLVVLEFKFKKK